MKGKMRKLTLGFACMLTLLGSLNLVNAANTYRNSTMGSWNGITVYVQEGAEFTALGWSVTGGTSLVQSGYALYTSVTSTTNIAVDFSTPSLTRGYTVGITAPSYAYGTVSGLRNYW